VQKIEMMRSNFRSTAYTRTHTLQATRLKELGEEKEVAVAAHAKARQELDGVQAQLLDMRSAEQELKAEARVQVTS
jgi:hypothetical protein